MDLVRNQSRSGSGRASRPADVRRVLDPAEPGEESLMSISRLVCAVMVCGLILIGTGDAQARGRRCGAVGYDPYAGAYGQRFAPGYAYPGYARRPAAYSYPVVAQPFYGGQGAYYGGLNSPYAAYDDQRRRQRRRNRNIALGIGAAVVLGAILSR